MFGSEKITKTMEIEGMSCMHCAKKVEDSLKALKGVKNVTVNLEEKKATVVMKQEIANETLKNVVEELGYEVKGIV